MNDRVTISCSTLLQRAEAEAAKLYEDFVESFGEGDEEDKSFVKGETIQPNSSFQNSGNEFHQMQPVPPHRMVQAPANQSF